MTAFCQSSTSRSHPLAFTVLAVRRSTPSGARAIRSASSGARAIRSASSGARANGNDNVENVPEPVQSSLLVDTPEDEPADGLPDHDPGSSPRPDAKHPSDQEHAP